MEDINYVNYTILCYPILYYTIPYYTIYAILCYIKESKDDSIMMK